MSSEVSFRKDAFRLSCEKAYELAACYDTPLYVYSESHMTATARELKEMPSAFGHTVRFAMKSAPNASLLQVFRDCGLQIDASSSFEAWRAIRAGIPAQHIRLASQQLAVELPGLVEAGVQFTCCSFRQLRAFMKLFPKEPIGLRINPGLGSGEWNRTTVGGPTSSFGIWHEQLEELPCEKAQVRYLHSHIGAGADPEVWLRCAERMLTIAETFENVSVLNLGGGFKVGRIDGELHTEIEAVGKRLAEAFREFSSQTGRELHLEIEPGSFLVANAGVLLARVDDVVATGADGYRFIKLDSGMTEVLRPSLYGAIHPIELLPKDEEQRELLPQVVVGHCCESGDLLTPVRDEPERILPRVLPRAEIGDLLVIGAVGAYASSMSTVHYNSFPQTAEILLRDEGKPQLIRSRETLEQIVANERYLSSANSLS